MIVMWEIIPIFDNIARCSNAPLRPREFVQAAE